jgi:hypothetical protein
MPRSRNKYSRAAIRARSRRTRSQRSSTWFYAALAVILALGVVGIVLTRSSDDASAGPPQPATADTPGDHWHAAFGVNVCGEWLSNPPEFETAEGNSNVRTGIHTHGDGYIHIHPFFASEGGDNATLGKFLDYGGWSTSENSIDVWTGPTSEPSKTQWSNGDRCPSADGKPGEGKPGRVVFQVDCKTVEGNPSDHKLADQEVVAIGFLPKGEEMGAPPNAASAPADDGSASGPAAHAGCRPSSVNNPGVADTTPATTAPATTSTTTR